jgi:drug/metabolite transporter (DMT)-like permease
MINKRGVPLAVFGILILSEIFDCFGQFCFKKTAVAQGVISIASLGDAFGFLTGALCSGYLWMGLAAVTIVLVSWLTVLSKVDLSVAMPVTSVSYVFVALVSLTFLHEHVSPMRWFGILFILAGVAVVSTSSDRGEDKTR